MVTKRREVLIASRAAQPIGPYSLGIRSNGLIFVSGTIGVEPHSGKLVSGGIEAETRQALDNLSSILESGGSALSLVVKTTVFLSDLDDYPKFNEVYGEYFSQDPPARSTVEVSRLPGGAAVEIEAIAVVGEYRGD